MILRSLSVTPSDLLRSTGWESKPQGLCKGDICVPAPDAVNADGSLDAGAVATKLRMPIVHDEAHSVWAFGAASIGGKTLDTVALPPLSLEDKDGVPFDFAALKGRKAIVVAWASW